MDGPQHALQAARDQARARRRPERWSIEARRGRPPPRAHGFAAARRHADQPRFSAPSAFFHPRCLSCPRSKRCAGRSTPASAVGWCPGWPSARSPCSRRSTRRSTALEGLRLRRLRPPGQVPRFLDSAAAPGGAPRPRRVDQAPRQAHQRPALAARPAGGDRDPRRRRQPRDHRARHGQAPRGLGGARSRATSPGSPASGSMRSTRAVAGKARATCSAISGERSRASWPTSR